MFALLAIICGGCGTTAQRTAIEQLLLSEAVDNSVNQIDFEPLAGMKVYFDTSALKPVTGQGIITGEYVGSALKQKMLAARCLVQESRETADIIVEARVGALATNGHDVVYGLPASNGLTALSSLGAGPALPPIPELSVARSNVLAGMSKVAVFAYERESREPVWQSGSSRSETNARSSWFLGVGPFVRGNVFESTRFAGANLKHNPRLPATPKTERVPLRQGYVFSQPNFDKVEEPVVDPDSSASPGDGQVPGENAPVQTADKSAEAGTAETKIK